MTKSGFEPFRLCFACRKKFKKNLLIRVAKFSDGVLSLDLSQKLPGRGIYVCCNENCFKILKKKRGLAKGLRCAVPDEIYDNLEEVIKGRGNL